MIDAIIQRIVMVFGFLFLMIFSLFSPWRAMKFVLNTIEYLEKNRQRKNV